MSTESNRSTSDTREVKGAVSDTAMADYFGVSDPHVAYEQGVRDAKAGRKPRHEDVLIYMDGWRSVTE